MAPLAQCSNTCLLCRLGQLVVPGVKDIALSRPSCTCADASRARGRKLSGPAGDVLHGLKALLECCLGSSELRLRLGSRLGRNLFSSLELLVKVLLKARGLLDALVDLSVLLGVESELSLEVLCGLSLARLKALDHGFDIVCRLFGLLLLELFVHDASPLQ